MRKVIGIGETVLDIIFKDDNPVSATPGGSVFNREEEKPWSPFGTEEGKRRYFIRPCSGFLKQIQKKGSCAVKMKNGFTV